MLSLEVQDKINQLDAPADVKFAITETLETLAATESAVSQEAIGDGRILRRLLELFGRNSNNPLLKSIIDIILTFVGGGGISLELIQLIIKILTDIGSENDGL